MFTYRYSQDRNGGDAGPAPAGPPVRATRPRKTGYAVGPQSYRSFFVGGMIMLGKKAKVNGHEV